MNTHIRLVAILHIGVSALILLGVVAFVAMSVLAGSLALVQGDSTPAGILGIIAVVLGGFLTLLALPGLVGGWALYTGRSWGRPVVVVLGALHLINFPIGTVLGVYTLWALLSEPESNSTAAHPSQAVA